MPEPNSQNPVLLRAAVISGAAVSRAGDRPAVILISTHDSVD